MHPSVELYLKGKKKVQAENRGSGYAKWVKNAWIRKCVSLLTTAK